MATTKALIIGVSKYFFPGVNDLSFCKNDIVATRNAFIKGLGVAPENIITCGLTDVVTLEDFVAALLKLKSSVQNDDILLFYFSGHGATDGDNHYLVSSDKLISTQEIITYLDAIPARSKVVFLDCCHAGNFQIDGAATFDVESTVSDFAGKGYAIFASSNAAQSSYSHPNKPISLFTYLLCDCITSRFIIKKGKKSLNDIHKLLFLLLESWNKHHQTRIQTPIYRANIGGTIFFDVEDYQPYNIADYFFDGDKYCICCVNPLHNGIAKRYAVKAILKEPMSFAEISLINLQIIDQVRSLDIFGNKRQEEKWKGKPANLIFCYFGLEQADIESGNYICHTTWADETQDKNWWYRIGKPSDEIINGIHFSVHSYYQSIKEFTSAHTGTTEEIKKATNSILSEMITLAEYVISQYNELLNKEKNEEVFVECVADALDAIKGLYLKESDLDIPPENLREWSQLCTNISSDIYDFALFYGHPHFLQRTPENRKQCMDISIERYYADLEKLKKYEDSL